MDSTFEIQKEVVGIEVSPSVELRKKKGRHHTKPKWINAMIVNFMHGGMVSMR
jgi:hypothetical protein